MKVLREEVLDLTKFEQIGVERQLSCDSISDAKKFFEHSCLVCCTRGMRIECDRCSIAYVNKQVMASFEVSDGVA